MNCPPQNRGSPSFPSLYNPLLERYRDCEQPDPSVTYLETPGDIFRFTLYWTLILYTPVFVLPALWGLLVHFIPHRLSRKRRREATRNAQLLRNSRASALSLDRRSNIEVISPRSSEPLLLASVTTPASQTTRDRTVRLDDSARYRVQAPRRPTISQTLESWTPSLTLRSARLGKTDSLAGAPLSPIPSNGSHLQLPVRRPSRVTSSLRNRSVGITCLILVIPLVFIVVGAVVGVFGSLVIGYLLAALRGTAEVKISTWLPLGWAIIQVHTVLLGCFTNMISFI